MQAVRTWRTASFWPRVGVRRSRNAIGGVGHTLDDGCSSLELDSRKVRYSSVELSNSDSPHRSTDEQSSAGCSTTTWSSTNSARLYFSTMSFRPDVPRLHTHTRGSIFGLRLSGKLSLGNSSVQGQDCREGLITSQPTISKRFFSRVRRRTRSSRLKSSRETTNLENHDGHMQHDEVEAVTGSFADAIEELNRRAYAKWESEVEQSIEEESAGASNAHRSDKPWEDRYLEASLAEMESMGRETVNNSRRQEPSQVLDKDWEDREPTAAERREMQRRLEELAAEQQENRRKKRRAKLVQDSFLEKSLLRLDQYRLMNMKAGGKERPSKSSRPFLKEELERLTKGRALTKSLQDKSPRHLPRSQRQIRLGEEIKDILNELLDEEDSLDYARLSVGGLPIEVCDVNMDRELRRAEVWWRPPFDYDSSILELSTSRRDVSGTFKRRAEPSVSGRDLGAKAFSDEFGPGRSRAMDVAPSNLTQRDILKVKEIRRLQVALRSLGKRLRYDVVQNLRLKRAPMFEFRLHDERTRKNLANYSVREALDQIRRQRREEERSKSL